MSTSLNQETDKVVIVERQEKAIKNMLTILTRLVKKVK